MEQKIRKSKKLGMLTHLVRTRAERHSFLTGYLNPCHASLSRITGMKCKLAANAHAIFLTFLAYIS